MKIVSNQNTDSTSKSVDTANRIVDFFKAGNGQWCYDGCSYLFDKNGTPKDGGRFDVAAGIVDELGLREREFDVKVTEDGIDVAILMPDYDEDDDSTCVVAEQIDLEDLRVTIIHKLGL